MTTESNHNDPGVSEAYRDLANESTPPELDRKILSVAAAGSRSRYGLARAWLRPVAWAATIGLSLAFVLEMSQFQDAPVQQGDVSNEAAQSLGEPAQSLNESALTLEVEELPAAAKSAPRTAAKPARDAAHVSADFEVNDMTMLRDAEEQARARVGSAQEPDEPIEGARLDAAFALEKKEALGPCDTTARASAETWYACIEEIRDAGDAGTATTELAALLLKFPDFEEPGKNR